jgi:hypothetical protein
MISYRVPYEVERFGDNSPAEQAGLQVGDQLIALNGEPLYFFNDYIKKIPNLKDEDITLTAVREGTDTINISFRVPEEGIIGVYVAQPSKFYNYNIREYNFVEAVKEYGERARKMKKLFTGSGFRIVYDRDEDKPLADGFYFTVAYPGFTGVELVEELLYYGISGISLATTGSKRLEGIRACVSLTGKALFPELEARLVQFNQNHS